MKRIKKWLSLGLVVVLAFALAACNNKESSGSGSGGKGSDEQIELNFWSFGATGYDKLIEEYEKEHPNIKIKFKTSETADHHDALFTALSAGSGAPDIALLELDQLDRFKAAQDRFNNLYDLGAKDVQDKYLEWKWDGGANLDGDFLIGLPTDIGPKALYYRTDVFEAAGLPTEPEEVEKLISSPEAFVEAAKTVKEKTGKPFVDTIEMAYRAYLDTAEEAYLNPEGELIADKEGSEVKKAYDFAAELWEKGYVGPAEMWSPEWSNGVKNGDFAVALGAGWFKGWLKDNAPEASGKFRVANLPEEFAANWGGSYLSIPKETEHAQEAYDFIEWLVAPEQQLKSFQDAGLFPSAVEVYDMEEFKSMEDEFFGGQVSSVVFAKAAQDIQGLPFKGEKYFPVHEAITNGLLNVQTGKDPEKEWEAGIKKAKDLLSR
ncbi:ABC transporter substrate-binding protein [Metabacillus sp. 22489]|uniref:ABC transporter substrate-binding protein n=1 Tax=Metabacillus sp. 22489 TaxID=3453928 RepID=UPI003F85FE4D